MSTPFDSIGAIGERYLNSQTSVNNGELINLFDKHTSIPNYINQLMFNSSRYIPININGTYQFNNLIPINNPNIIISAFTIFWLCTFMFLLIFLIISLIYQTQKEKQNIKEITLGIITIQKSIYNVHKKPKKKLGKAILIFIVVLFLFLWIIFLFMLCVGQSVTNIKLTQNQNNSDKNSFKSLKNAINISFTSITNMYTVATMDSMNLIKTYIGLITNTITNQIQSSIINFTNTILQSLYVNNIFNAANKVLNALNIVINSMGYVYQHYQSTFSSISQTKGKVSVYQASLEKNLDIICKSLSVDANLQKVCNNLKTTNLQFQTLINTSQINTDSSVIMLFFLRQYSINITAITDSYQAVNKTFNSNLNDIFKSALNSINVASYLNFIPNIWNSTVIPFVSSTLNAISSSKSDVVSTTDSVSLYENIVLILLIIIIFILISLTSISYFREELENIHWNKYLNLFLQITVLLFGILSALIAILLIIIANFMNIEICRQFNTTDGIILSDQMIDEKLKDRWVDLSKSLLNNPNTVSINLMQPRNIILGISTKCRNPNSGLLFALGMKDFVNVSQVFQSSSITNTLLETQKNAYSSFIKLNPSQVIPQDIHNFINQSQTLTKYVDSQNYTTSLAQLSIPIVGITDYVAYFHSLSTFVQSAKSLLGNTNEIINLNDTANQLLQNIPSYNEMQLVLNTMKIHFENLQVYRNNTQLMQELVTNMKLSADISSNVTFMGTMFNETFKKLIMGDMITVITEIVNSNLTSLTNKLVPCGNLSLMYEALTTSVCSSNNVKDNVGALGIILIIVTVFCQILVILITISTITRLQYPKNISRC